MVRLFTALELPGPVRGELAERLAEIRAAEDGLRWIPPERWHITLGFYGDREHAQRRGTWFRRQAAGLAPTRLRLCGAGRFPGVLWIGVSPLENGDATALHTLAGALNADNNAGEHDFAAHLTVARWRRGSAGGSGAIRAVHALAGYSGSWWTASEVVLFRSDTATNQAGEQGPVYTPLDRVALASKQG